jgi:UDP-glucose 4-epimerase
MTVLILGGGGFVGLNIARLLLDRGHAVTLFDRAELSGRLCSFRPDCVHA